VVAQVLQVHAAGAVGGARQRAGDLRADGPQLTAEERPLIVGRRPG
jgi:hypothetical protein